MKVLHLRCACIHAAHVRARGGGGGGGGGCDETAGIVRQHPRSAATSMLSQGDPFSSATGEKKKTLRLVLVGTTVAGWSWARAGVGTPWHGLVDGRGPDCGARRLQPGPPSNAACTHGNFLPSLPPPHGCLRRRNNGACTPCTPAICRSTQTAGSSWQRSHSTRRSASAFSRASKFPVTIARRHARIFCRCAFHARGSRARNARRPS